MDSKTAERIVSETVRILADKKKSAKITLEDLAAPSGLHPTTFSLWEREKRSPTLLAALQIAASLNLRLSDALAEAEAKFLSPEQTAELSIGRKVKKSDFRNEHFIQETTGLSITTFTAALERTYATFDIIDARLTEMGVLPMGNLVELANLSSMIGNVLGGTIADCSEGIYARNRPHTYPDLLSQQKSLWPDIEIKIALETNKPKGHLAKNGTYLTVRYVLTDLKLEHNKKVRGPTPVVWEMRLGNLEESDFDISNTAGDSGKTAVVKTASLKKMRLIYFHDAYLPYKRSKNPLMPYPYYN